MEKRLQLLPLQGLMASSQEWQMLRETSLFKVMRCLNRDSRDPLGLRRLSGVDGDWSGGPGAIDEAIEDEEFHSLDSEEMENKDFGELKEENKRVKEQICKFCMQNPDGVIFLPCAHLVCCETSASAFLKWPTCTTHIQQSVKTFL